MTTSSHSAITRVVSRLIICVEFLFPHFHASAKCRVKYKQIKISKKAIAEQERAEADGHQPWRNDAKSVASVGLVEVEPDLKVSNVDELPVKEIVKSDRKSVLVYINRPAKKTYQATLRRFKWRDPLTGNEYLTVWWLTEIIVRDCSKKTNDQ